VAQADGGTVGVRVPARAFTSAVIQAGGVPLLLSSANEAGDPPLCDAAAIAAQFGEKLDWIFDGGPSELQQPSTVVRISAAGFEVLRTGILSEQDLALTAAHFVLFVCTGNTCRSPIAEFLLRSMAARELGCEPQVLHRRGLVVGSAGLSAYPGEAASAVGVAVMREKNLELDSHRTKMLTTRMVEHAACIFTMTHGHRERLIRLHPFAVGKTQVLRIDGMDVMDPFGGPEEEYRQVRDQIQAALEARLAEVLALATT
jgi:protein-tyrosine phosphatase